METTDKLIELCKSLGIRIEVGGCGCCESPWLRFEYKGEMIFDDDSAEINMFDDTTQSYDPRRNRD